MTHTTAHPAETQFSAKALDVHYDDAARRLRFTAPNGQLIDVQSPSSRRYAAERQHGVSPVGSTLGSGSLIAYLSRDDDEEQLRLVILTVLTQSGDHVAGPQVSELLGDYEAGVIMNAARESDDPIRVLREFLTFRPDRRAHTDRQ